MHQGEEDRQLALEVLASAGMHALVAGEALHIWSHTCLYSRLLVVKGSQGQPA